MRCCSLFRRAWLAFAVAVFAFISVEAAESFRIASFNLENYLDSPAGSRPEKSAESRAKIRESILAIKPDVLALQEMGTTNALLELRSALKAQGLDLPHWEWVRGFDTNIHLAVLSRFPLTARRPHTNDTFLLQGRRFRVSRGFLEVDVQVNPRYQFTLINAHLKSRRPIGAADEAEMRYEEALILREKVDARLRSRATANLVVLGDLNDVKDSRSTRAVIGRGRAALFDTRPYELNGDVPTPLRSNQDPRAVVWTHFYAKEDSYSRIDYILLSPGMAREWTREGTFIATIPNWGLASDHRPIVATFIATER
jgi:endonuclease/exonuclease/phosphatase family metal-dependent hydrolase